jgi:hypothetical protein
MALEDGCFIAQVDDREWEPALPLGLPPGVKWRLYEESDEGVQIMLVRFPPGYIEPRHVHEAEHFDVIVDGEMHVNGKVLTRGDYLRGVPHEPHGPMAYPVGCTVFAVIRGGSIRHEYDEADAAVAVAGVHEDADAV